MTYTLPENIDQQLSDFAPETREALKAAFERYDDFYLVLANGRETYMELTDVLQVIRWGLLPTDLQALKFWDGKQYQVVWSADGTTAAADLGWRVVYDYGDDEDAARFTYEGKARPFDRADTLKLISPEGEVLEVFDVIKDSHYGEPVPEKSAVEIPGWGV